mmetsp:Transcript_48252/g.109634  ORF Transcript_48252/g.109634 Transcript_48252/m.109634 type:complete len:90 (+) Transcript_48252:182-451(+)
MSKLTKDMCQGGRWTPDEHELFVKGMSLYGRRWTKVAEVVGTRTTVQVKFISDCFVAILLIKDTFHWHHCRPYPSIFSGRSDPTLKSGK